jgi:hypothetical protein
MITLLTYIIMIKNIMKNVLVKFITYILIITKTVLVVIGYLVLGAILTFLGVFGIR